MEIDNILNVERAMKRNFYEEVRIERTGESLSLPEAVACAEENDTLTLLKNVDIASTVVIDKSLTFDGGEFTLTYTGEGCAFDICGDGVTVNISSGTYEVLRKSGDGASGLKLHGKNNTVNINGGKFISYCGTGLDLIGDEEGTINTVNINGGYFDHMGHELSVPFINVQNNTVLNIYSAFFDLHRQSAPIYLASPGKVYAYGGTFICKVHNNISVGDHILNYGMTLVNSISHADIDIFNYRPMPKIRYAAEVDTEACGIRFTGIMPAHAIKMLDQLKDAGSELSYGMLISKAADFRDDFAVLNFDTVRAVGIDYLDIKLSPEKNEQGNLELCAELTEIEELTTDYGFAPYVKYIKYGKPVYIFGNFSAANIHNVKKLAARALAESDGYTEAQLDMLEKYAGEKYDSKDTAVIKVFSLNVLTCEPSPYNEQTNRNGYIFYKGQDTLDYTFERRLGYIRAAVDYVGPDIMFFQEYSGISYWGRAITLNNTDDTGFYYTSPQFPGYTWVNHRNRRNIPYKDNTDDHMKSLGHGRNPFHAHNFVLYSSERFERIASGTEFVSKNGKRPDIDIRDEDINNLLYNNSAERQGLYDDLGDFTWVVLREKSTGLLAIYASIHVYSGEIARYAYYLDNMQCVFASLEARSEKYGNIPVIIGGDFNMYVYDTHMKEHYEHIVNVAHYLDSKTEGSDYGTCRDMGGSKSPIFGTSQHGVRLDYIFTNGADTYGYEALGGQIVNGKYDHYAQVGTPSTETGGYDISDHLPIMTNVILQRGRNFTPVSKADYYTNPNTENDILILPSGNAASATNIRFDNAESYNAVHNADERYGSQYMGKAVVDDAGNLVLRIAATDETNYVNTVLADTAIIGSIAAAGKTVTVKYKIELMYCADLRLAVVAGETEYAAKVEFVRDTRLQDWRYNVCNGVWKTAIIEIPPEAAGNFESIKLYGRSNATALLAGDAVYIESIIIS